MRPSIAVFALLVQTALLAELPPAQPAPQGQGQAQPSTGPAVPNRGVQVFDDRVFQLSSDKQAPTTRESADGKKRYLAEEPDYNTETYANSLEQCSPLKEKDPKGYKSCFKESMKKSKDDVRRKMNAVEQRQGEPLRNTGPIPDVPPRGDRIMPNVEIQKD